MTSRKEVFPPYCPSRYIAQRRTSREVSVGDVSIGGENPIRIQSMTTTPTQDVFATVKQTIALVEAGCEIVRITAQNITAAKSLKEIRRQLHLARVNVPLVADIHFIPSAAMEAAEHVDKVRINPGNYSDQKKFVLREYSDTQYDSELGRLYEDFSPIVLKCRDLGRSMRIGTNHGSLSDRIMNRYGDTPLGMVESALEFIRIAESHSFKNIILSMKSSNPKVMIEAYRLVVSKMSAEGMNYPLHLGVTEAGDGDDARIKSAIGIGSLLFDGLGDTIRVSLTEDPVNEIPVAKDLAEKAWRLWESNRKTTLSGQTEDPVDPFSYTRRKAKAVELKSGISVGANKPPCVIVASRRPPSRVMEILEDVERTHTKLKEARIEGLLVNVTSTEDLADVMDLWESLNKKVPFLVLSIESQISSVELNSVDWSKCDGFIISSRFSSIEKERLPEYIDFCEQNNLRLALDIEPDDLPAFAPFFVKSGDSNLIFTVSIPNPNTHPIGNYRALASHLLKLGIKAPIWIRNTQENSIDCRGYFGDRLLEAATLTGALLCDGIGDIISIELEPDLPRATSLAYNILQGARARISKTEYVACPSCGRTLFDLQSTTQKVRSMTDHLKGVTIAVMGCIVNGPGEMADADFGYVGGAPGKINLYVGKKCVEYHIPEEDAVERLINLIKKEQKWIAPPAESSTKIAVS